MASYTVTGYVKKLTDAGRTLTDIDTELRDSTGRTLILEDTDDQGREIWCVYDRYTLSTLEAMVTRATTRPDQATERQVAYLRSLGATDEQVTGITKRDASRLIDTLKARRGTGHETRTPDYEARAYAAGRRYGVRGQIWDD